jgi:hypothetical protein
MKQVIREWYVLDRDLACDYLAATREECERYQSKFGGAYIMHLSELHYAEQLHRDWGGYGIIAPDLTEGK